MGIRIDVQIKFSTIEIEWLCFRHAVIRATAGEDIDTQVNDFMSEYYCGMLSCGDCSEERKKTAK